MPSKKLQRKDWAWGYLFIAPSIIGLVILNIYPFFQSIGTSLVDKLSGAVGFSNYVRMFTADSYFWQANLNTLIFTAVTVPIGVFISLVLASVLNRKIGGKSFYRAVFFLPLVCAPAAIAMVWKWVVLNQNSGMLNHLLSLVGIEGPDWVGDPHIIMISLIMVAIWSSVGYDMILLLAGLKGISATYYEAAKIDGANAFQQFKSITIPLISPVLFFVIIMRMMNAIRQFDLSFMFSKSTDLTFGSVQTLIYEFYRETFVKMDVNYGASIAVWTVIIIMLFTLVQFIFEKKWVYYDD